MLKKEIKYTDYNGNEQTETFYFQLTRRDMVKLGFTRNGLSDYINKLMAEQDNEGMIRLFDQIIIMSYGKKSFDGKTFLKNPEDVEIFQNSAAYDELFFELLKSVDEAQKFVAAIMPKDIVDQAEKSSGKTIEQQMQEAAQQIGVQNGEDVSND